MNEFLVDFDESGGGLHCTQFEVVYAANAIAILAPRNKKIVFRFSENIFFGIDAALRLLTLCNYLVLVGKKVRLEFEGLIPAGKSYLERTGFFDFNRLHPSVEVLPYRILGTSSAVAYDGNSENLVEIQPIKLADSDCIEFQSIPGRIGDCIEKAYEGHNLQKSVTKSSYTLISELGQNIIYHSNSLTDGYASYQRFPAKNTLKIAVSDCGEGILETVRPALIEQRHKDMSHSELLLEMLNNGKLSRLDDGGGSGLYSCAKNALMFKAWMWIRLPKCSAFLRPQRGSGQYGIVEFDENVPFFPGTHISFRYTLTD